ncbi:DUF4158 domain-containing protein [Streptomyces anulatus]|uniref:DUF4158 domain-containing protein n=1 Tax=Streptomyces anulatus TaxID=1892 RepID=UPI0022564064|nr:DUF4158 domain-containing protein [Streptomyces anulatus]MCX4523599.1 DUF4158 domain-containing protein [Streptomyces anulatus]MCX4523728.1 DUF4158 domain-containing protein [Streptomyces anulatus]MCX4606762.1 DUF4158 domain-containing protein [Streptomyces anulatus]MCX4606917.1 DUF4158 domain-containing protein [Streptomyces anulatus]WTD15394.1 DUF4158 domain-containing protein [Streptomyces anulatus]
MTRSPATADSLPLPPGELEQFFRLDVRALAAARSKRAPTNRLGWVVQWGCVRMLGVFPTEDLSVVPETAVRFAAGQFGVGVGEFAVYGARRQNWYEHAWEIRDVCGYREFSAAEAPFDVTCPFTSSYRFFRDSLSWCAVVDQAG